MGNAEATEPRIVIDQEGNPVRFDDLVNICDIVIDPALPRWEREKSFFTQIKTPRLFRCGDLAVRAAFASNGVTITDLLKQYLLSERGARFGLKK
jgi:hypothetical protein